MPRGPRQHAPPGTAPSSAGCSIRLLFRRIRRCLRLIRCDLAAVRGMDSPSPPGLSDAARQQLILLVLEIAGSLHSVTVLPPRSDGDSTGSDEEPSYVYTAFMLFVTVRHFLDWFHCSYVDSNPHGNVFQQYFSSFQFRIWLVNFSGIPSCELQSSCRITTFDDFSIVSLFPARLLIISMCAGNWSIFNLSSFFVCHVVSAFDEKHAQS